MTVQHLEGPAPSGERLESGSAYRSWTGAVPPPRAAGRLALSRPPPRTCCCWPPGTARPPPPALLLAAWRWPASLPRAAGRRVLPPHPELPAA